MAHFKEAKAIWTQFIPRRGQAETIQGELLRAVEKLRDSAIRNGNANWDHGFDTLLAYLSDHLLDVAVFAFDVIGRSEAILVRLRDHTDPLLEDGPYDELYQRPLIATLPRSKGVGMLAGWPAARAKNHS